MPMYQYVPGQNGDAELMAWYLRLVSDGDLERLFGNIPQPLSAFFKNFTDAGMVLVYETDDDGWSIVGWYNPFMGAAAVGLWVRPDKRGTATPVRFLYELHVSAFQQYDALIISTHQEQVVDQMTRLGYTKVGEVASLYGPGKPGTVLYLKREDFAGTLEMWKDRVHGRSTRSS